MDFTDVAAAAASKTGKARCGCTKRSKEGKPSKTCDKCQGKGTITACSGCQGSGFDAKTQRACHKCAGRGCV